MCVWATKFIFLRIKYSFHPKSITLNTIHRKLKIESFQTLTFTKPDKSPPNTQFGWFWTNLSGIGAIWAVLAR